MQPIVRLFTFAGCLCLACWALANDEAPQKPTTQADWSQSWLKFQRRQLLEAYQDHGDRNPKWDLQAEAFLDEWAAYWAAVPWAVSRRELELLADGAMEAGCRDPLVLGCYTYLSSLRQNAWAPHALEIAESLAKRDDAPHLAFVLAVFATDAYHRMQAEGSEKEQNEKLLQKGAQVCQQELIRFLNPKWIRPGEERAAFQCLKRLGAFKFATWPGAENVVTQMVEQSKVDPWVGHVLAANFYYKVAWAARGSGYANTVTPEGWKLFGENMEKEATHLRAAYKLHPEWPEAAAEMIDVVGAGFKQGLETPLLWHQRAVEAQVDYMDAYSSIFQYSLPRWGGSDELVEKIAEQALHSGRFDTEAPGAYLLGINRLARYEYGKSVYWPKNAERLYPNIKRMCEGYEASEQLKAKRNYYRSIQAIIAWHAKQYEDALQQLQKLDDKLDPAAVYEMAVDARLVTTDAHIWGGKEKAAFEQVKNLLREEKWDETTKTISDLLERVKGDEVAKAYLQRVAKTVELQRQLATGQWVDLTFDKDLTGWIVNNGQWRYKDQSTIVGRATGQVLHITFDVPIGHRFEYKGEVSIPKLRYNTDNAGPAFCEALTPLPRMRSFLVAPSKKEIAIRRGLVNGQFEASEHVLPQGNAFLVTVWDKSVSVRLNGEVVHQGNWLEVDEDYGDEEHLGLGGHFWYEGPDVIFRNLQVRKLVEPPSD